MKKIFFIVFLLVMITSLSYSQDSSVSVNLGMDFFNYEEIFLNMGGAYNIGIARGMEASLGMDFALWAVKEGDTVKPSFFIPINAGLNFIFMDMNPKFLLGVGVSPLFILRPEADPEGNIPKARFYIGPYVRAGIRLPVHDVMSWFVLLHQDLSIGTPYWINTATRITTGINFSLVKPQK